MDVDRRYKAWGDTIMFRISEDEITARLRNIEKMLGGLWYMWKSDDRNTL
jgi:hypothetical protein